MSDSRNPPATNSPGIENATWINTPPISVVSTPEAARIAGQLQPATAQPDAAGTRGSPFGPNGAAAGLPAYVYRSSGPPLGLMALEISGSPRLRYLGLTSDGEGMGVMVEHALNLTMGGEARRTEGLRVVPVSGFVAGFLGLGFVTFDNELRLDPQHSQFWTLVAGQWRRPRPRGMAKPGTTYSPGSGWTYPSSTWSHNKPGF